jgi:hypothetical protein
MTFTTPIKTKINKLRPQESSVEKVERENKCRFRKFFKGAAKEVGRDYSCDVILFQRWD